MYTRSSPYSTVTRADAGALGLEAYPYPPTAPYLKTDEEFVEHQVPPNPPDAPPKPSRSESATTLYRSVSWICGFNEKYSLVLFIFFGGALIGFCLGRTLMMNPANVRDKTVPGEWFWYRQKLYKPCIFIHIYLSIISGFFAVFQFLPAIRRRSMILHRINGYMTIGLLTPSTIAGAIVARRAFGGELNVQSAFWTASFMTLFCSFMGIANRKRTRKHRKWMLRTVAFATVNITAKLTSFAARHIVSDIGSYYAVWRCDEISFLLNSADALRQSYPQCAQAGEDLSGVHVPIRAAVNGDKFGLGSSVRVTWGMSLWIAIVIHILSVETYIRLTDSANRHRLGFVLQRTSDHDDIPRPDDR